MTRCFSVYVALTYIPGGGLLTGFAMRSDPNFSVPCRRKKRNKAGRSRREGWEDGAVYRVKFFFGTFWECGRCSPRGLHRRLPAPATPSAERRRCRSAALVLQAAAAAAAQAPAARTRGAPRRAASGATTRRSARDSSRLPSGRWACRTPPCRSTASFVKPPATVAPCARTRAVRTTMTATTCLRTRRRCRATAR